MSSEILLVLEEEIITMEEEMRTLRVGISEACSKEYKFNKSIEKVIHYALKRILNNKISLY